MTYDAIRPNLRTGDIVLFSGKGNLSQTIKTLSGSRWSHVGMVMVLPEYDFVCLWESTTLSTLRDLQTGDWRRGVQLTPLSIRIKTYDGDVAVRHLLDVDLSPLDLGRLNVLRRATVGVPYEVSKLELLGSLLRGVSIASHDDLCSLFCSEAVAEAYQTMGLIGCDAQSKKYAPARFSQDAEDLPWLRGRLGDEIPLTFA